MTEELKTVKNTLSMCTLFMKMKIEEPSIMLISFSPLFLSICHNFNKECRSVVFCLYDFIYMLLHIKYLCRKIMYL